MSRPPKKAGTKRPRSRSEDKELWDKWSKSVSNAKVGKPRVRLGGTADEGAQTNPATQGDNRPAQTPTPAPNPRTAENTTQTTHQARSSVPHRVPGLADFDNKSRRRLGRGRIEIAARLDLHGMRRHEAHDALRGFLFSAQARGLRWVLVITGKGMPAAGHDAEAAQIWQRETPIGHGVLRQSVPQWLAESDLRAVVVSHTLAAPNHGGEGARYIQLRTRRRNI